MSALTRAEFEAAYAVRSGVTVAWLHEQTLHGYRCDCGEEGCEGWQMLSDESAQDARALGHIPEP